MQGLSSLCYPACFFLQSTSPGSRWASGEAELERAKGEDSPLMDADYSPKSHETPPPGPHYQLGWFFLVVSKLSCSRLSSPCTLFISGCQHQTPLTHLHFRVSAPNPTHPPASQVPSGCSIRANSAPLGSIKTVLFHPQEQKGKSQTASAWSVSCLGPPP